MSGFEFNHSQPYSSFKDIMDLKIDENSVNKHWRVYLDFGRASSLSLQLY